MVELSSEMGTVTFQKKCNITRDTRRRGRQGSIKLKRRNAGAMFIGSETSFVPTRSPFKCANALRVDRVTRALGCFGVLVFALEWVLSFANDALIPSHLTANGVCVARV